MYANACKLQKNTFHPTMYLVSSHRDNFTMQLQSACDVNKINCYLICISFHPYTGPLEGTTFIPEILSQRPRSVTRGHCCIETIFSISVCYKKKLCFMS